MLKDNYYNIYVDNLEKELQCQTLGDGNVDNKQNH
jgi:hypothetical protein